MSKSTLKHLLPILLVTACTGNKKNETTPPPLFPQPQAIELNKDSGYTTNVVTGDTIQPIILENGDTLITGVPIPAIPKIIHPDSVAKPKVVKAPPIENLEKHNAHPNRHKIPDDLTVIPVNKDSLTVIPVPEIDENDTTHYLVNSTADTIKTGVPIPAKGKKVKFKQPHLTNALQPTKKEFAIANFHYLDVNQGMNSSYVYSILEDRNGNIWFATRGGGVSCYNGKTFRHFTDKEGMSDKVVMSICEDRNGNLWFGTWSGGVSMYNGETFMHFTEDEGMSNNAVWSILEDQNENIWFGTWGGGVSKYDGNFFTHYTEKEGLSNNAVFSIYEDKKGNLWFGTWGGGVTKYDGDSFTHFTEKDGLINNNVTSILEDKNGSFWFCSGGEGVSMYDGDSFTYFTEKEGLSNNDVWSVLEDKKGKLWFCTRGGGVNMYNGETTNSCREGNCKHDMGVREDLEKHKQATSQSFTHYTEKEGLSNNTILSIIEDNSGNLWFGTWGGGVNIYKKETFMHFTQSEGLSYNSVYSISEDEKGNLWIGTDGGGVNMYNGKTITHLTEKDGLSNNSVWSILEDKNKSICFGTSGGGANVYNEKTFTHYTDDVGLSSNSIVTSLKDENGNLWFGFGAWGTGVSMFDGETTNPCREGNCKHDMGVREDLEKHKQATSQTFGRFTQKEGLSNNAIWAIYEDKKANLWFGTWGGGVSKYDGESFTHFTEKEGLSNNKVVSILEDKSGNLWFGTWGGVNMFDGKTFRCFTEKEGLNNNIVTSILEDQNGNIWIGTDRGLNLIPHDKNIKGNTSIVSFTSQDGLLGLDFNGNSAFIDSENKAWWGSGKGLTMLDLNNFKLAQNPPRVYLNQIDINEQFIDYYNITDSLGNDISFNGVRKFENYPLNLELPYHKNHLTFHFVAIDWAAPHKIHYSYLLEGLDKTWSQPTKEPKAEYRNLPFGAYTFKIRAIGESGEWSEPFEYTFTIHPPWWHTWWARAFYALLALTLLLTLFRWRTSSLRKRQEELEKTVEERTAEVVQQKEHIEEVHKEITDSINYAERIQRSFLATKEILDQNLKEYFVFFQPKDVVSGDFYWASQLNNGNFAIVNADSTGHGVPGAIMSIANIACLKESITKGLVAPNEIFNETRRLVIEYLKNDGSPEGGKDGMDASIVSFDFNNNKIEFATANNPVWLVRNNEVIQFQPDKMPIGKHDRDQEPFTLAEHDIQKEDVIYTLTDGFQDQFGGEKGKKFMVKRLREFLLSISHLPMQEQHDKLIEIFQEWKGNYEQVDDVCIIGVRL
ncbi:MAG: two-component regulator propeller domain-containing protein [Crocinitomicaceae bacterium]